MPPPTLRFVDDVVQIVRPAGHAAGPERPALSIESCRPWIRIALEGASLGWARPAPSWQTLIWIGEGRRQSLEVIPPIEKKELGQRSWPAFFARALSVSSRSPLSPGAWELSALAPRAPAARDELSPSAQPRHAPYRASGLLRSVHEPTARLLPWVRPDAPNVVALRMASDIDAARVKSWRKEARAGTLPPALLLWVSSMAGYLLLDGHDRVLAASLEGAPLGAVALYNYRDEPLDEGWQASAETKHARVFSHQAQLSDATRVAANRALIESWVPYRKHPTTARYVPDLAERFEREHTLNGLPPEIRAALSAKP